MSEEQQAVPLDVAEGLRLVENILTVCPDRRACSDAERRAQRLVAERFEELGLQTEWCDFRFSTDLYSVLALHFAVGSLGSLLGRRAPGLASALHLLAGGSYWADSTHRGELLRRLRPRGQSQNLLASVPARTPLRLRIVVAAHIDAAPTGLMFRPEILRLLRQAPLPTAGSWLDRPLSLVTYSQLALAALDGVEWLSGRPAKGSRWLRLGMSLPGLLAAIATAEVARHAEVVPGASDDLTGVAAAVVLAERLQGRLPPSVELVLAITGAEEAGLGGARALACAGRWDPACTVVLGLDTLCGGELRYFEEGEIEAVAVPGWLERVIARCGGVEGGPGEVRPYAVPVGHTDVYAFRRRGFDGVCLGAVDSSLGAPRHYHLPTDTLANLDPGELSGAVAFAERLVWAIVDERLGVDRTASLDAGGLR